MAETIDNQIFALLETFGDELVLDIKDSLASKGFGSKANGGTQDTGIIGSTNFKINTTNGQLVLEFYMDSYWYYLEYGRGKTKSSKTKKPFKDTLAGKLYQSGWDVGKGINAKVWYAKSQKDLFQSSQGKSGSLTPEKHKAFKDYEGLRKMLVRAIASGIHKKGTIKRFGYKGSRFLSNVLKDGRFDKLSQSLSDIIGKQIVIDITESFNKKTN